MTADEYQAGLPAERIEAFGRLRRTIRERLPAGFAEQIQYGMIGYVVPHGLYPKGYHCDPREPLPFMGLASQKQSINLYHMGLYADPGLMDWFLGEWAKVSRHKLDRGKSCLRFKYPEEIPFEAIGELAGKIGAEEWIRIYEERLRPRG
jgi:hypothetical protein